MKVKLIDPTGISLADGAKDADGNLLPFDVSFTREGPHGTLYRINNEWYAARRFEVVPEPTSRWVPVDMYREMHKRAQVAKLKERMLQRRYDELSATSRSDIQEVQSEARREIEGLKGDVKAAEDAYTRVKEQLDQAPREVDGQELFDTWDLMAAGSTLHLYIRDRGVSDFYEVENIIKDSLIAVKSWIAVTRHPNGQTAEHYFSTLDRAIIKVSPPAPRATTAKEWLITYTEDDEPTTDGLMTYPEARDWLLCNGSLINFEPVMIYKRCESGQMLIMTPGDFMDQENAERWQS